MGVLGALRRVFPGAERRRCSRQARRLCLFNVFGLLVKYYEQVKDAADASNDLARRMVQAGNFNKLAQMRQQAFYADATSQLARTRQPGGR
jgi:hypothetical protein